MESLFQKARKVCIDSNLKISRLPKELRYSINIQKFDTLSSDLLWDNPWLFLNKIGIIPDDIDECNYNFLLPYELEIPACIARKIHKNYYNTYSFVSDGYYTLNEIDVESRRYKKVNINKYLLNIECRTKEINNSIFQELSKEENLNNAYEYDYEGYAYQSVNDILYLFKFQYYKHTGWSTECIINISSHICNDQYRYINALIDNRIEAYSKIKSVYEDGVLSKYGL